MKNGLSLFLAAWLTFSSAPSSFQAKPSSLAPKTESFYLTGSQKKQARALIETLNYVEAHLKHQQTITKKFDEKGYTEYEAALGKREWRDELIPSLRFYQIFGEKGISELLQKLEAAIQDNKPLPEKQLLNLDPAVGIYQFLLLSYFLEENVFCSMTFSKCTGAYSKPLLLNLTLDAEALDKKLGGFKLFGEEADTLARALFNEKEINVRLQQTKAVVQGIAKIDSFKNSIDTFLPKGDIQKKIELFRETFSPQFLQKVERAIQEKEGNDLKEALSKITEAIEDHLIVLGKKNGASKITFINLPATTVIGMTQVEIQLPALLRRAQRPEQNIINEVGVRLFQKPPTASAYEANLSQTFSSFSNAVLQDDETLYQLLQILTQASLVTDAGDIEEYGLTIQKNILNALQQKRPDWFDHALNFLNEEKTFKGMVAFLAATGWIDPTAQNNLNRSSAKSPFSEQVRTSLIYNTNESLYFHFKRNLFFPQKNVTPFSNTTAALAFLKLEPFQKIAKASPSLETLPSLLAEELVLKKTMPQTLLLYNYAFTVFAKNYNDVLTGFLYAAKLFFDEMEKVLPPCQNSVHWFHALMKLMKKSGLSLDKIRECFRFFFYYHVEQKIKKELPLLRDLIPVFQATVDTDWLQDLLKKLEQARKTDDSYSNPYFYVNDLIPSKEDQSKNCDAVLTSALTSLKLLFKELGNANKIKNTPLALLEKLRKQDKELAYSLGLELLREKIAETRLMPAVLRFPLLEGSLKTLFETYPTSDNALEAAENNEPEINFLSPLLDPISFVKKYAPLFGLTEAEKKRLIPALAKNLIPPFLSVNAVEQSIVDDLRDPFQNNDSLLSILESAEIKIKDAPLLFLRPFEESPLLKEISEKLGLKTKIKNLVSSFNQRLEDPPYDYQHEKSKAALELMKVLDPKKLFSSTDTLDQFIQKPLHSSLITSYETQIRTWLASAPAALEESL